MENLLSWAKEEVITHSLDRFLIFSFNVIFSYSQKDHSYNEKNGFGFSAAVLTAATFTYGSGNAGIRNWVYWKSCLSCITDRLDHRNLCSEKLKEKKEEEEDYKDKDRVCGITSRDGLDSVWPVASAKTKDRERKRAGAAQPSKSWLKHHDDGHDDSLTLLLTADQNIWRSDAATLTLRTILPTFRLGTKHFRLRVPLYGLDLQSLHEVLIFRLQKKKHILQFCPVYQEARL